MEILAEILKKYGIERRSTALSSEEYAQKKVDYYNRSMGDLTGYDCPKCRNKGNIMFLDGGYERVRECGCMKIRRTLANIEKSGLKNVIQDYTFDKFTVSEPWQCGVKQMAADFLKDHENKWFFAGGQVGSGKTHLCTAIVVEFIKKEVPVRYMLWRDEIVTLKAVVTDEAEYSALIKPLKETDVLYIDDFFKTERNKNPTAADINIAFEIINYRYLNPKLITIISSELFIDDIVEIDEAVGSRIYQRSQDYCVLINYDRDKNYRLKGRADS